MKAVEPYQNKVRLQAGNDCADREIQRLRPNLDVARFPAADHGMWIEARDATGAVTYTGYAPGYHELVVSWLRTFSLAGADAAIPGLPVTDTVKVVRDGVVVDTPPRDTLVAVQTPQAFRADVLRRAHANGGDATDDAALVEAMGSHVVAVDGDSRSRKITHRDDLEWARRLLSAEPGDAP